MQTKDLIQNAYSLLAKQAEINYEQGMLNTKINEWLTFYDYLPQEAKEQIDTQLEFVQNINE